MLPEAGFRSKILAMFSILFGFLCHPAFGEPSSVEISGFSSAQGKCKFFYSTFVHKNLSAVPGLKKYIEAMVNDPNTPETIRRIILNTLDRPDVTVVQLTDALTEKYLFERDFDAFHNRQTSNISPSNFKIVYRKGVVGSKNTEASRLLNGKIKSDPRERYQFEPGHSIFVQDRAPSAENNDLSAFVHELAHVKFDDFLEKNIAALQKKFPMFLKRKAKGKIEIDEQFYHYLRERHGYEIELATVRATQGKYFSEGYKKWVFLVAEPDSYARTEIADYVARVYKITDPILLALREKSLSEILLKGLP